MSINIEKSVLNGKIKVVEPPIFSQGEPIWPMTGMDLCANMVFNRPFCSLEKGHMQNFV